MPTIYRQRRAYIVTADGAVDALREASEWLTQYLKRGDIPVATSGSAHTTEDATVDAATIAGLVSEAQRNHLMLTGVSFYSSRRSRTRLGFDIRASLLRNLLIDVEFEHEDEAWTLGIASGLDRLMRSRGNESVATDRYFEEKVPFLPLPPVAEGIVKVEEKSSGVLSAPWWNALKWIAAVVGAVLATVLAVYVTNQLGWTKP